MRTENQIQRKLNEFKQQLQAAEARLAAAEADEERQRIERDIHHLEDKMMLLEWVLFEPTGSYHG
ncbi:hypothetical protein O9H85_05880 [Paenibacillus filicis]|uniref:Uncharacterized protein n=1 Tax=Paenibacillus gyeongsangnamensis TaxID=3388067 RepID=A0ABT4Q509_9BACL|nr:hypothetical protein [Paenibacillus filicis]MCZ8511959.1 hypothetical protein [Paenibacillus filicis]